MAHTYFIFEGKKKYVKALKGKSVADFPLLKKEFNLKKNNIDPKLVPFRSQIKFFWKCKKGHEFQVSPGSRFAFLAPSYSFRKSKHSKCIYCLNKKVCEDNNLKFLHPKIAKMWNYKKNTLKPNEILANSHKKVWWICKNKHEFKKLIYLHVDQKGFCGGCGRKDGSYKTFATKENCLKNRYPELAKEWHPTKNKTLKPDQVYKTTVMYWWQCPKQKDHVYKQTIYERVNKKVGCSFCAFKKLTKSNSLKYMYPTVASQWHPTKNGKLTPEKITAHSHKKAWWICKKKHVWQAMVVSRTKNGHGCKKCTGVGISYMEIRIYSELINIFRDIKWSYKIKGFQCDIYIPQLRLGIEVDGAYWHNNPRKIKFDNKKNNFFKKQKLNLIRVRENSLPLIQPDIDINAYFIKPRKEDINNLLDKIKTLTNSKRNLREINKYKKQKSFLNEELYRQISSNLPSPVFENSLAYKRKDLVKEWDYKKNFPLVPSMFKIGANLSVWWICKKKHSYKAVIGNRTVLKRNCPYCVGRYALPKFNLKTEFPEVIKIWNYKLNKLKPENYTPVSGAFVWWNCSKDHIYRRSIAHRTSSSGSRNRICPCETRHQNGSLYKPTIYPLLRDEFSKKNNKKLEDYNFFSKEKVIWKCKNKHEYKNSVYRRIFYAERCFKCIDKVILTRRPLHDKNDSKMLK